MTKYQKIVKQWVIKCFGKKLAADRNERNHRFLEESLELVQALGCTSSEIYMMVDYVFSRPKGEPFQEVGGVMVTLTALCAANNINIQDAAYTELERIQDPKVIEKIRAKQLTKPSSLSLRI